MLAITRSLLNNGPLVSRQLHTSITRLTPAQSPLYILRQKTGLAYTLCREALNKHDNNVEEAESWLKAHALAHGLQKASKVRDRSAREGLVCLSIPKDNKSTTLVELNCETDFVAKNQVFKDFAIDITNQIAMDHMNWHPDLADCDVIRSSKLNLTQVTSVENQIVPLISKLGENIKLTRALRIQPSSHVDNTFMFGRIHAQAAEKETDQCNIMAGRFGAIVALRYAEDSNRLTQKSMRALGDRLCQHIIGYNPSYIELPDNVKRHLEEIEKEKLANKASEVCEASANDEMSEEQSTTNFRDDWPSLMDQTLIMTDDLVVRDFCRMNNISIVFFDRFECGMES